MSKIKQQYYHSSDPFTVHVNYGDDTPEADFPSIEVDEQDHEWVQTMWPYATITTQPEHVASEEVTA